MRYLALAADYDGTLAADDRIADDLARAIERLKASGRRAILLTGRRLDDLLRVCPHTRLFDLIVAENGAIISDPQTREEVRLANPPSKRLVQRLHARGVEPLEIGQVVVATREAHRATVQDVVWELGIEAQVIGNRGAVMVLPAGVNKATGMASALRKLGLSRHEVVGVGDAENDHSFLECCECAVAVANAIPSIKDAAAWVTQCENGSGVRELIDALIAGDLRFLESKLRQHWILLGTRLDGTAVQLPPYGHNMLIAGPSGSGKSSFAAAVVERLIEKDYQICIVDPEGDYGALRDVVALGNQWRPPGINEVLALLNDPKINLSINLLGIPLADRPEFVAQLIPNLSAMRARTGRPHWLVLDEAHHMLPDTWGHTPSTLPQRLGETILVTVHPERLSPTILSPIDCVVAVGHSPERTLRAFGTATDQALVWPNGLAYQSGAVIAWFVRDDHGPFLMQPRAGRAERIRHHRKYAEGDLRGRSFYFRGPDQRHNLKAQNLTVFCQIAEGIDEETWLFHLRRGDYSRWFRQCIKDDYLADETDHVARRADLTPWETRQVVCGLVNARYTLPE